MACRETKRMEVEGGNRELNWKKKYIERDYKNYAKGNSKYDEEEGERRASGETKRMQVKG